MGTVSHEQSLRLAARGLGNWAAHRPLVVSFEVTYSCTCDCRHCNHGGRLAEEELLEPGQYTALVSTLRPCVVQISGGEPLLRPDVLDIVRAAKRGGTGLPHVILVTNASLLDAGKYAEAKEAGVDRFSISLDLPDARHDASRGHPGLYAHLEETVPGLARRFGNRDIALNCAITRWNLPHLVEVAERARQWGVAVSYSAYGVLRTGNREFFISSEEDLATLKQQIEALIRLKRRGWRILNSPYTLRSTYRFFRDEGVPRCPAGIGFLVVRPDGSLVPCSMKPNPRGYATQGQLVEQFTRSNRCGACFVAIRAYSDKPLGRLMTDSLALALAEGR